MTDPVQMAVDKEGGKVVLHFNKYVNRIDIDPQNCLDISEAMATAAFECRDGVKPVGPALKAELVDRHRAELIPRVTLMLGSMRGDKKVSDGTVAMKIIDAIFSKVFS